MKIVHVVECFAGGTAQFVNLATHYMNQHEHIIIHGDRKDEISVEKVKASFPDTVSFLSWKHAQRELRPFKDIRALVDLCRKLKVLNPDVIHLHSSKAGFIGRAACKLLGMKNVVFTPHGAAFLRKDITYLKLKLYRALEKQASRFSGSVVCCSKSEAEKFNEIGINASFINNGIRLPDNRVTSCKSKHGNNFTIVTSGRITAQKEPLLFNKIAEAFSNNKSIQFIWIGEGEKRDLLTSSNITVTGWIDRAEVLEILAGADLYISTSSWEGLPFSVLEAMSLGKGLLVSDCIGNIDLVDEGYNGYVFRTCTEAIQKINRLRDNRNILEEFGKNSVSLCYEKFNIVDTFDQYLSVYKEVEKRKLKQYESMTKCLF